MIDLRDRDTNPHRMTAAGPGGVVVHDPTPVSGIEHFELYQAVCPVDGGPRPWWRERPDSPTYGRRSVVPLAIARHLGQAVAPSRRQQLRRLLRLNPVRRSLNCDRPGVEPTIAASTRFATAAAVEALGGLPAAWAAVAAHEAGATVSAADAALGESSRTSQARGAAGRVVAIWTEPGWPDAPDPLDRLDVVIAYMPGLDAGISYT